MGKKAGELRKGTNNDPQTAPQTPRKNNIVAEERHNRRVIYSRPILFTRGKIYSHPLDVSLGSGSYNGKHNTSPKQDSNRQNLFKSNTVQR